MIFVQGGKLGFLGGEDKVDSELLDNGQANRLAGIQGIAEVDRLEYLVSCSIFIRPSLPRIEFAVLFGRIVLRFDELRAQQHHAVVVGGHQRGRQYPVKILKFASTTVQLLYSSQCTLLER